MKIHWYYVGLQVYLNRQNLNGWKGNCQTTWKQNLWFLTLQLTTLLLFDLCCAREWHTFICFYNSIDHVTHGVCILHKVYFCIRVQICRSSSRQPVYRDRQFCKLHSKQRKYGLISSNIVQLRDKLWFVGLLKPRYIAWQNASSLLPSFDKTIQQI